MIQGDVCWHKFKEPDKTRPVLILTRSEAIPRLTSITVAPVTSTLRDLNSQVWLTENDGMLEESAVNLDFIQTVSKDKLGTVITHLSDERMQEVFEAVRFAFGFDK